MSKRSRSDTLFERNSEMVRWHPETELATADRSDWESFAVPLGARLCR